MTEEKSGYKFFKIGNRPFRARYDFGPDVPTATETWDEASQSFVINMQLIDRIDGDDTWELSKEEFATALQEYRVYLAEKKTTNPELIL